MKGATCHKCLRGVDGVQVVWRCRGRSRSDLITSVSLLQGYGDPRTLARRVAKMEAWLEKPTLMEADPEAEYAAVIEIPLDDIKDSWSTRCSRHKFTMTAPFKFHVRVRSSWIGSDPHKFSLVSFGSPDFNNWGQLFYLQLEFAYQSVEALLRHTFLSL